VLICATSLTQRFCSLCIIVKIPMDRSSPNIPPAFKLRPPTPPTYFHNFPSRCLVIFTWFLVATRAMSSMTRASVVWWETKQQVDWEVPSAIMCTSHDTLWPQSDIACQRVIVCHVRFLCPPSTFCLSTLEWVTKSKLPVRYKIKERRIQVIRWSAAPTWFLSSKPFNISMSATKPKLAALV
jgi:hypothetical protein